MNKQVEELRAMQVQVYNGRREFETEYDAQDAVSEILIQADHEFLEANYWRWEDVDLSVVMMELAACTGFRLDRVVRHRLQKVVDSQKEVRSKQQRMENAATPAKELWGDGGYAGLCAND